MVDAPYNWEIWGVGTTLLISKIPVILISEWETVRPHLEATSIHDQLLLLFSVDRRRRRGDDGCARERRRCPLWNEGEGKENGIFVK
jgi:hypothetical protein